MTASPLSSLKIPEGATGVLVLADGTVFFGKGFGRKGHAVGEVCFNTAMTGYQEVLTDPSYASQIINFTFPHIGNVGTNDEDMEATNAAALGFLVHEDVTGPSNYRAAKHLVDWAQQMDLVGLSGADTRRLTRHIRMHGPPNGTIAHDPKGRFDLEALLKAARDWPGLKGMDLARAVTTLQTYTWDQTLWQPEKGYGRQGAPAHHVVAIDYGVKRNILRCLAGEGMKVTVLPCTASAGDILGHDPDGIFLSNGPGDPAATADYTVSVLKKIVETGKPVMGICLGHQLLALALGAKTEKMHQGHRGANHPVKDLESGKVEITSMNHGFTVSDDAFPDHLAVTHRSLFDGTIVGLKSKKDPVFSVQYHPEASPGPQDSRRLFARFRTLMEEA